VKPLLQVAVQDVPLVLVLEQLNTPFAGLVGLAAHTTGTAESKGHQKQKQHSHYSLHAALLLYTYFL
jgi:hypothetical protein